MRIFILLSYGQKFLFFMVAITNKPSALHAHFFAPLAALLPRLTSRRCPQLSDTAWLQMGICRVVDTAKSGREFLQSMRAKLSLPKLGRFFETLRSSRRLSLCAEANRQLVATVNTSVTDVFAHYACLHSFDLYAADGHSHGAAAHDPSQPSKSSESGMAKFATSHIYALNLRSHALTHLAIADQVTRRREHEIRTLKRLTINALRQNTPAGRKVLYVYDPACIDYALWHQLKQGGVYLLTRAKSNTRMLGCGTKSCAQELADPLNAGVLWDDFVGIAGRRLRHIRYLCPLSQEAFDFITNELTLPPGMLARIYLMRWDIEKVYDEIKNKFNEQKAWASTANAKMMQAQFICLAHNLMVLQEHRLLQEQGVSNTNEIKRKAQRLAKQSERLAAKNTTLPKLLQDFQRLTQRSVKYIRWLRTYLYLEAPWASVVAALRHSYAEI
jgi:Transposase DDE domain